MSYHIGQHVTCHPRDGISAGTIARIVPSEIGHDIDQIEVTTGSRIGIFYADEISLSTERN